MYCRRFFGSNNNNILFQWHHKHTKKWSIYTCLCSNQSIIIVLVCEYGRSCGRRWWWWKWLKEQLLMLMQLQASFFFFSRWTHVIPNVYRVFVTELQCALKIFTIQCYFLINIFLTNHIEWSAKKKITQNFYCYSLYRKNRQNKIPTRMLNVFDWCVIYQHARYVGKDRYKYISVYKHTPLPLMLYSPSFELCLKHERQMNTHIHTVALLKKIILICCTFILNARLFCWFT